MAEVWEAHDENLDRAVAVKMLHGHLAGDAGFVSRFRREALSIAKLSHPNVVAIFDTGVEPIPASASTQLGTRAYIVMELIRGESLRALLQKGLTMSRSVDIVRQAAEGLAYAHRNGLVHRDVKPGNILVQADGRVKVVDFGIAKLTDRRVDDTDSSAWLDQKAQSGEDLTQVGAILGTAKYLAPEQVEGGLVDARSDIYALGVVLYEGVCGRPPFSGKNDLATALKHVRETAPRPRQVRPGIPRSLEAVITKAMSRNPADRYATADDLSSALHTIDLRADDAQPVVSRSNDDVTPPSPIRRTDGYSEPPGPSGAKTFPAGLPTYEPTVVRSATVTDSDDHQTTRAGSAGPRPLPRPPRRLIPVLAVVGLLLGAAVGIGVATFVTARNSGQILSRAGAQAYDPFGDDNEENDELAKNAVDGDLDTSWRTSGYRERNFNGAKEGVGLIVRLRGSSDVSRIRVVSPSRGWSAKIYVAEGVPDDFSGWGAPVGSMTQVSRTSITLTLDRKRGSTVLLWITELGPKAASQEFTRVIVQEITPRN